MFTSRAPNQILRDHAANHIEEFASLENKVMTRIKEIISTVHLSKIGEALEFNIRLEQARAARSLNALRELHSETLKFRT